MERHDCPGRGEGWRAYRSLVGAYLYTFICFDHHNLPPKTFLNSLLYRSIFQTRKTVVLDVRNGYEWDAGHFAGAGRPAEEVFAETPVGQDEAAVPEPLKGAPSDTPVMM